MSQSATWFVVSLVALLISITCIYGLWRMKRWAVVLLASALIARIGYSIVIGQSIHLTRLLGPIVLLGVGLLYFRRMT